MAEEKTRVTERTADIAEIPRCKGRSSDDDGLSFYDQAWWSTTTSSQASLRTRHGSNLLAAALSHVTTGAGVSAWAIRRVAGGPSGQRGFKSR